MKKDKNQMEPLSLNEKGQLQGGFIASENKSKLGDTHFFADNGNCKGGGWGDSNVNCNNSCAGCNALDSLQPHN